MKTEALKRAHLGFVGCGNFSTSSLYPVLSTIPEIELSAICDRHEDRASRNAKMFGAGKYYTDLEKMLSCEKLDGAVIVGRPGMHYEVGKRCLEAGLPIYVEKPSANTVREALQLAELAENKGLFGAVGFMKRQSTCYKMAKKITGSKNEFGEISAIEVRFANGRYPDLKAWGWENGPAYSFLVAQCVHVFDLVRFFCGEIEEVYAGLNEVEHFREDAIFAYAATLKFKNGAVGVMNINSSQGPDFEMSEYLHIAGRECSLEVKDMMELQYRANKKVMPEFDGSGRSQIFAWKPDFSEIAASTAGGLIGYRGEMQNFARALLGLEKPGANLKDGAKALQIADGIWKSAQTGKAVKLEPI